MPVVVVEVSPAGPPAPLLSALIAACSASLEDGHCEAARETEGEQEHAQPAAVAIVRWNDSVERSVGIEVAIRQKDAAPAWQSRTLTFEAADARIERWRSVGLTISTLAGELASAAAPEQQGTAGATSPPAAPKQTPPAAPPSAEITKPAATDPASTAGAAAASARKGPGAASGAEPPGPWLGVGAFGAPGVGSGVQLGGYLEGGFQTASPVFARLTLGLSAQPGGADGADVNWITGSAGAGLTLRAGPAVFRPRAGVRLERAGASIDARGQIPAGSASLVQLGAVIGGDVMLARGPHGFFLGVEAWRNRSATEVRIGSTTAGTSAATGWSITFGYRYRFGGT